MRGPCREYQASGCGKFSGLDPGVDAQIVAVGEAGRAAALSLCDTQYALVDSAECRCACPILARCPALLPFFAMANPEAAVKIVLAGCPQTVPSGEGKEKAPANDLLTDERIDEVNRLDAQRIAARARACT